MSVQTIRAFLIAASAMAAIAAGSPAFAAAHLVAGANARAPDALGGPGVTDRDFQIVSIFPGAPRPGSLHASAEAGGFGALSVSEATADFGVNRVFARTSSPDLNFPFAISSAVGSSHWDDELTISTAAPGGFLSVEFQFHAFTNQSNFFDAGPALEYIFQIRDLGTGNQQTPYRLAMDANGNTTSFLFPSFRDFELTGDNDGDVLRLVGLRIPFVANQAFAIISSLTCQARAPYDNANVQVCDANSTSLWGGITGATDLNGVALTDWTARSTSGTDYTRSLIPPAVAGVPEPATWAMLIVGFAAIGGVLRRDARARRFLAEG